jgi:serine/threonine-protein kinase
VANSFAHQSIVRERYQIDSLIGQGGMGAVYRVTDLRLPGRLCALKVLQTQPRGLLGETPDQPGRQQFMIEASTLARLDHPNLPKVSDYFTFEDYDCLVMDYVPGQDLQQHIQEARRQNRFLPLQPVMLWIDQMCDVLTYLHSQGPPVIHGDIKPANIKLMAGGRIKLVDFGLVRPGDPSDPRTLSGSGLRGVGSLPYSALEQYAGNASRIDARTDLYSLGATFYHLVTNQAPASAHDRFLDPDSLVSPDEINPALPRLVAEAILAAMQPHPKDRPVSVAAWRRLLGDLGGPEPGSQALSPNDLQAASAEQRHTGRGWPPGEVVPGASRPAHRAFWSENGGYALLAALLVAAALLLTFFR